MSKYRPYSWTSRSPAAFETPNSECVEASIDIVVSIPLYQGCSSGSSKRVSVSTSGRWLGRSPYTLLVEQ